MVTIVNAASRRLERLIAGYRERGATDQVRTAEMLRLAMYELQREIDQLSRGGEPAAAEAAGPRIDALLDGAESALGVLLQGSNQAAALPAVTAIPEAADGAP
jgi:hypothetical protein